MYVNWDVCLRNTIIWKVTWWSLLFLYITSPPGDRTLFLVTRTPVGIKLYIYRDVVSIGPLEIPSQHTLNGKVIMCKDDKLCPKKSWNHNNSAMYPCITMWKQVVSDFVTRQKSMSYIWQCGRDMLSPFYISFFGVFFLFVIFFLNVVKNRSWGIQKSIFDCKESGSQFAPFNWIV